MFCASLLEFGNVINSLSGVVGKIEDIANKIGSIFSDVDFSILWDWLPNDIQSVLVVVVGALLFACLIGFIKHLIVFLG